MHTHPDKRALWDLNRELEWYAGLSLNHYRCIQYYIPRTRVIINSNTVEFFLYSILFPQVKLQDYLKQLAADIILISAKPPSTIIPTLTAGNEI